MAGINVIIADTDEQANELFTTLIRMFVGVLTGKKDALQAPTAMNEELEAMRAHPAVQQMLKYSFVGSKKTVKKQLVDFIEVTKVDELITVSTMFSVKDRIKSAKLFAEVMMEINTNEPVHSHAFE